MILSAFASHSRQGAECWAMILTPDFSNVFPLGTKKKVGTLLVGWGLMRWGTCGCTLVPTCRRRARRPTRRGERPTTNDAPWLSSAAVRVHTPKGARGALLNLGLVGEGEASSTSEGTKYLSVGHQTRDFSRVALRTTSTSTTRLRSTVVLSGGTSSLRSTSTSTV